MMLLALVFAPATVGLAQSDGPDAEPRSDSTAERASPAADDAYGVPQDDDPPGRESRTAPATEDYGGGSAPTNSPGNAVSTPGARAGTATEQSARARDAAPVTEDYGGGSEESNAAAPTPAITADTRSDSAIEPQRPVYVDIVPVGDARYSMLPEELVAALASEALSDARQAAIRMSGQEMAPGVRVLKIMYIVHEQQEENGVIVAASASVELLRTVDRGAQGAQTLSIYHGLQQTLVQGPNVTRAREQLRSAFKKELQARIGSAFENPDAR